MFLVPTLRSKPNKRPRSTCRWLRRDFWSKSTSEKCFEMLQIISNIFVCNLNCQESPSLSRILCIETADKAPFLEILHFQLRNGFAVLLAKGLQKASFSFTVWLHLHNATGSIILISYEMTKVLTMPKERLAAVLHRVCHIMRVTITW